MQVREIMNQEVKSCRPDTNLSAATAIMWSANCGVLPVVDAQNTVTGMITDRDICMAVGTRNRLPAAILVSEVKPAPQQVYTCSLDDNLETALKTMRQHGVRRLPVVNGSTLCGILTLDDIALHANKPGAITYDDVVETLKAICGHSFVQQAAA